MKEKKSTGDKLDDEYREAFYTWGTFKARG